MRMILDFDFFLLDLIAENLRCPFLDFLMPAVTSLGNAGVIWIILAAVLLVIPKTRRLGAAIAVALVLDLVLCNLLLKPIVARIRPYDLREGIELIIKKPSDYSFPSGHTAASFTSVFAMLFFGAKKRFWIPAAALASTIAFSRLYLYVHYPTDVLGGIFVGLVCGICGTLIVKAFIRLKNKKSGEER